MWRSSLSLAYNCHIGRDENERPDQMNYCSEPMCDYEANLSGMCDECEQRELLRQSLADLKRKGGK